VRGGSYTHLAYYGVGLYASCLRTVLPDLCVYRVGLIGVFHIEGVGLIGVCHIEGVGLIGIERVG
jgi:hypothetical protein